MYFGLILFSQRQKTDRTLANIQWPAQFLEVLHLTLSMCRQNGFRPRGQGTFSTRRVFKTCSRHHELALATLDSVC